MIITNQTDTIPTMTKGNQKKKSVSRGRSRSQREKNNGTKVKQLKKKRVNSRTSIEEDVSKLDADNAEKLAAIKQMEIKLASMHNSQDLQKSSASLVSPPGSKLFSSKSISASTHENPWSTLATSNLPVAKLTSVHKLTKEELDARGLELLRLEKLAEDNEKASKTKTKVSSTRSSRSVDYESMRSVMTADEIKARKMAEKLNMTAEDNEKVSEVATKTLPTTSSSSVNNKENVSLRQGMTTEEIKARKMAGRLVMTKGEIEARELSEKLEQEVAGTGGEVEARRLSEILEQEIVWTKEEDPDPKDDAKAAKSKKKSTKSKKSKDTPNEKNNSKTKASQKSKTKKVASESSMDPIISMNKIDPIISPPASKTDLSQKSSGSRFSFRSVNSETDLDINSVEKDDDTEIIMVVPDTTPENQKKKPMGFPSAAPLKDLERGHDSIDSEASTGNHQLLSFGDLKATGSLHSGESYEVGLNDDPSPLEVQDKFDDDDNSGSETLGVSTSFVHRAKEGAKSMKRTMIATMILFIISFAIIIFVLVDPFQKLVGA